MRTTQFPLVDKLVGDDLAEKLDRWRGEKQTFTQIRDHLRDEYGVTVSTETLRRWHASLTEKAS